MKQLVILIVEPTGNLEGITQEMMDHKHKISVEKVKTAMTNGQPRIVVTNSSMGYKWDACDYVKLANEFDYTVFVADNETHSIVKLEDYDDKMSEMWR